MGAVKRVFVPGFFTHEAAEEMFAEAADVELVWALPEAGHTYATRDLSMIADPEGAALARLWEELPHIHALHAMGPAGPLTIDASIMDAAPNLEVVFIQAAGADSVDMAAATSRGIAVVNAAGANSPTVAEHTIGLLLSATRLIAYGDRLAQDAKVNDAAGIYAAPTPPTLLKGKRLGLVGLGHVGKEVARIARHGFQMDVIAFDPMVGESAMAEAGVRPATLEEVLTSSDVVSLHAPLVPATQGIIGRDALQLMRPQAYLVNTSRGGLVDTDALLEALRTRTLAGAALDVTDPEPLPQGHPLFDLDNVVITPHVASRSVESSESTARISTESVLAALRGERPACLMNPEVWDVRRVPTSVQR